ncbi:MAG: hypothetical protein QOH15_306 [Gaiellales bacterium]|jgi:hypothetical protein|nr:hypothetical protein [Gaiellales bacterium]
MSNRAHVALAALVLAVAILASPATGSARPVVASPGVGIDFSKLPGLQTGPAPWTANADSLVRARLDRLGLPVLTAEQLAYHIHVHLDVYIRGVHIPVPAYVGIDFVDQFLTVLHTHDTSGVVHIESASPKPYALGKFFGVWGVRLTASCIGRYCTGPSARLRTYLGGKPYTGNPASIVLRPHEEIVLAYGTKAQLPRPLPAKYAFAPGL